MEKKSNVTILYVDDEEINLFLFEKNLQSRYNIITAISGKEGLEKLNQFANDIIIVISDMRMPLMNGLEFISQAKKQYQNIAYFILTGFDFSEDIEDALNNNLIQKYFTKPFEIKEMVQAIDEQIKRLTS